MIFFLFALSALIAYLLGSLNGAIMVSKLFKKGDIRKVGSGNAGSTNVLRSVGKKAAAMTFVFDILKGIVAVIIAVILFDSFLPVSDSKAEITYIARHVAGIFSVIGHVFPLFYKFKGGKGVATSCAVIGAIDYRVLIVVLTIFIISMLINKIVSLSSILAAITYPFATAAILYFFDLRVDLTDSKGYMGIEFFVGGILLSLALSFIVIIKHKDNIKRLKNGTEKPIIGKK